MKIFSDGSDLKGVTRTQDLQYMKVLRASLVFLRAWPEREVGEKGSKLEFFWRCYILGVEMACVLPGFIYIRLNMGKISFYDIGHCYITWLMNLVAISRVMLIFQADYHQLVADFVLKYHLFNRRNKSELAMETHIRVHKLSHFLTLYILFMCMLGTATFNIWPLYVNWNRGAFNSASLGNVTLEPSVYYALPFDSTTNYKGYLIVFFANWYIAYVCASFFCTIDCLLSLMVVHIWGHLTILCETLEKFLDTEKERERMSFTPEENRKAFIKLKEAIMHHQEINEFLNKMSNTFGYVLFIYYSFHQLSGCLLLLECSQLNTEALLKYGPLTIVLFQQLIQMSVIFELLHTMGQRLADSVYSIPWEMMNTGNQKIVFIMLRQANLSLNLTALGMLKIGQRTMVTILKTTLSYFALLRTVADESS